jgi:hypothetical protein
LSQQALLIDEGQHPMSSFNELQAFFVAWNGHALEGYALLEKGRKGEREKGRREGKGGCCQSWETVYASV